MKVVILAGGVGTRIEDIAEYKPKPMIEVGGMPILWHIMKEYSFYGFNDFIICAGFRQHKIKEWFADYYMRTSDVVFDFADGHRMSLINQKIEPWKVTIVDTGTDTMTGGRIKRIQKYVGNEAFMMTYGDGVCDVNIKSLLDFHKSHGKIATLTSVVQKEEKGILGISKDSSVFSFREKVSTEKSYINAGYMVLEPGIFDYLENDETIFEQEPMQRLVEDGELMSYMHEGFWQCMDNAREKALLEKLWDENRAPWKSWK